MSRSRSGSREGGSPRRVVLWITIAALVGAAAIGAWLLLSDDDGATTPGSSGAVEAGQADLEALSGQLARPIYWLGPSQDGMLELSQAAGGRVFVRYLPDGADIGSGQRRYTTVATYPVANAYAVAVAGARNSGGTIRSLPAGGALITYAARPLSAYFVAPGLPVQVEVYDAEPGKAVALVRSGRLHPVVSSSGAAEAHEATVDALRALPAAVKHPVYWAGTRPAMTYELTRTEAGRVFIRYLPGGVDAGDRRANYLTVATYPDADPATVERNARASGAKVTKLASGRLLIEYRGQPTSAYLITPGEPVQVEVFSPAAGRAAALIRQGAIVPLA